MARGARAEPVRDVDREKVLQMNVIALALLSRAASANNPPPLSTRPNVVFFLVDDLGHTDVGGHEQD